MDIYNSTVGYLFNLPIFGERQDMCEILQRSASTRPRDWNLPFIVSQAVGGSSEKAIPATAALACAQISIILTDDLLDNDPRGEYRRIGHGRAANHAIAFQAAGVEALLESGVSPEIGNAAVKSLNEMMARTAFGQEMDVHNPSEETAYWRVVENKSAPFYGCAFHLGALFGDAKPAIALGLLQLGGVYGEMIQIHDDLNDTLAVPANPDWQQGRKPLPILYALTVDHPDQRRFTDLFHGIASEAALQEAQAMLIRCGAVSYCVDQLLRRHGEARNILGAIPWMMNREGISNLLDQIIAPVGRLFDALGVPKQIMTIAGAPGFRPG